MGRRLCVVAALLVLAAACGDEPLLASDPAKPSAGPTSTETPSLGPSLRGSMDVSPKDARRGQQVAMRFPDRQMRGIAFALEAWEDGRWQTRFYLASDGGSLNWTPTWWSVEDNENRAVRDIGVVGPGPDHVVIPDDAAVGTYRLCTANAHEKACAFVTVIR